MPRQPSKHFRTIKPVPVYAWARGWKPKNTNTCKHLLISMSLASSGKALAGPYPERPRGTRHLECS